MQPFWLSSNSISPVMVRAIVWLLVSGISVSVLVAQNKTFDSLSRTSYVERFTRHFFIWPVLKQRNVSFSLENIDQGQKLTFRPNVTYHAGIGFYIFGVGMQLVFALPASNASEGIYGHSSAFDLQANILGRHWGVDLFTQNYKGYYLDDKNIQLSNEARRPQRKDIQTWNNGFNGIYFFNKRRYSLRATYNYYERQLKSAGSIITSVNANTFSLRADSAILNYYYETAFGRGANIQRLDFTTFSIAPGYAYTLVLKKSYFIGCALAYGPSLNWFRYNSANDPWKSLVNVNTFLDLRLSTGYNAKHFFCGVSYVHQARNIDYEGVIFSNSNDAIKIAIGYRFKEVGILKRRAFDIFRPKTGL